MKATVKGRYEGDKATAAATLALSAAGDLRLRASATDAAFAAGPTLDGLTLTLEKPGSFLLDLKPNNQVTIPSSISTSSPSAESHHRPDPTPCRMCASSS
jgi:hypothetical protein